MAAPALRTNKATLRAVKAMVASARTLPLENGDRLSAVEFLRRFQAMPLVKKAELVDGTVHMPSPVSLTQHALPDIILQTWLGTYMASTPEVTGGANATVRLNSQDIPQPDSLMMIRPEYGGAARIGDDGFIEGPPELVVEIAGSSASIDLGAKLQIYHRAGVREYLVWITGEPRVEWRTWNDDSGEYDFLAAGTEGVAQSRVFPGLWLDVAALLDHDASRLLAKLQRGIASAAHKTFRKRLAAKAGR
ncbi:MAG TPA: Uma2 family endonuclease [Verrucomicrobiales bacterium]|jgi:Uma2 family endonuclease|nr:Uma2 family endonuclease [Verrucomicrobiales bacterium]